MAIACVQLVPYSHVYEHCVRRVCTNLLHRPCLSGLFTLVRTLRRRIRCRMRGLSIRRSPASPGGLDGSVSAGLTDGLSERDHRIVRLVASFKQLTSKQINELLFQTDSTTPCYRALHRLTEREYLARIERRLVGGNRGGSGQFVYQLGKRAFYMFHTGRYNPARAVSPHTIEIAEVYLVLARLHRSGGVRLIATSKEPDSWVTVGGQELKPDLYAEIERGETIKHWYEIDQGTEAQGRIKAKLTMYYRAWSNADVTVWPVFPLVVWVAVDQIRARELAWMVSRESEEAQRLFTVTTKDKLGELYT